MSKNFVIRLLAAMCFITTGLQAADRYVSLDGTNDVAHGYTSWAGAATNIIDAVSIASIGETIWVSNGTYKLTNHIVLGTNALRSLNGPGVTIIDGNNYPGKPVTNRCVTFPINAANACLDGFTISNGVADVGGGVYFYKGTISNCVICGNTAASGGGIQMGSQHTLPPAALLVNCVISNNCATGVNGGGGIFTRYGGTVRNCVLAGNRATNAASFGGGMRIFMPMQDVTVRNCLLTGNQCAGSGGGMEIAVQGLETVTGVVQVANCSFVNNAADVAGGGLRVMLQYSSLLARTQIRNAIIASNVAPTGADILVAGVMEVINVFSNCCAPTFANFPPNAGNITNNPEFADFAGGNYRLINISPCRDVGVFETWMSDSTDLDGRPRINRFARRVDMGCYEYISPGVMFLVR